MYKFDLSGKVALVTGGAGGLGNEYAESLAAQGCDVAIMDFNGEKASAEAARISMETGRSIRGYACDVTEEAAVIRAVGAVVRDFGQIDILVNNAGILLYAPFLEHSVERWEKVMDTNLRGSFLMAREVVKQSMKDLGWGRIVNIASIGGIRSTAAGCPSYHASKAGIILLTAAEAAELADYGILVNAISPGSIRNGTMGQRSASASNEEGWKSNGCPLKRRGEYGEVSPLLIMLVSAENTYINGQNIVVDGGWAIQM